MSDKAGFSGGCLCGAVRFVVNGPMRSIVACHCGQCRRAHGNFAAYSACAAEHLHVEDEGALAWYAASDRARRGFCRRCGSSLFWDPHCADYVAVAAGALDDAGDLRLVRHVYTAGVPDWYRIADGLEQREGSSMRPLAP